MIKKKVSIFIILIFLINIGNAQRNYISHEEGNGLISIKVTDGIYEINPYNDMIIHVRFIPDSCEYEDNSFARIMTKQNMKISSEDKFNELIIKTPGVKLKINKSPFLIQFYYKNKFVLSEKEGYKQNGTLQSINFNIGTHEILYGGGTRVLGMNRRGHKLDLYNKAHYGYETHSELMNYSLPIVISSDKYALFFDHTSKASLDLDSKNENTISFETSGAGLNYYFIKGSDWFDLTKQYTSLTGTQPIPPRWVFGNFSSRFGYHSQDEVLHTVEKYDKDSIPVDAVVIDIYWFSKGIFNEMGRLDWYKDSFPEPAKMIEELKKKKVKTILVTEPFILTTSERWDEAVKENILATDSLGKPFIYDFYFGKTGLIDVFKPTAIQWFQNIYKELAKQGIDGFWGDLGEPEEHPSELMHVSGKADEVHNVYGHEWTKLIFNMYQKYFPKVRPFILMRAGYAGTQRYGIIPWTGDVSRSWGGLKSQPELSLQMGMQGIAYMHSDLGGFAGGDSIDDELYTRWLQYGVFQPIFRPHAQEHIPPEPVFQKEETKNYAREAIKLRYKLLPYNYTMAYENAFTGKPFMIPLFFIEPDNRRLLKYDTAYMWGDAFLITPITNAGQKEQAVYFPKGTNWTDFYTGEVYEGGKDTVISVKPDHIPTFVKGGSFLPMSLSKGNTSNYNLQEFEMHYYYDNRVKLSNYILFNDDGETIYSVEKEMFETYHFELKHSYELIDLSVARLKGWNFKKYENQIIQFTIHNIEKRPKKIIVDGVKLTKSDWKYDFQKQLLEFKYRFDVKANIEIYK